MNFYLFIKVKKRGALVHVYVWELNSVLITRLLREWECWARKPVNHTSWVAECPS